VVIAAGVCLFAMLDIIVSFVLKYPSSVFGATHLAKTGLFSYHSLNSVSLNSVSVLAGSLIVSSFL